MQARASRREKSKKMKPIVIFGVCHTAATADETLKVFDKFPFNNDTLVFIEPRKSILKGVEICNDPNIMGFFKKVLKYLFKRNVGVVPLNPSFMPSHSNQVLYRKIAQQFAEEECMVDIIASTETKKQKVVVIGDIHAPRMRDLLEAKGLKVQYKSLSKKTPSDVMLISWREALLGHAKKLISIGWLLKFRDDLRKKLSLSKGLKMPAIFYGDEKMYSQYLEEAKHMMVEGKEKTDSYLIESDKDVIKEAKELKDSTVQVIKKLDKEKDHEILKNKIIR